jgi:thiamine kinase-like enzyme
MNEKYLEDFCDQEEYQLLDIISTNIRKDTNIILVSNKNSDKKFIVKIFGQNTPDDIKSSFESEIKFYKTHSFNGIPKFFNAGKNFFALEFFDGDSLPKIIDRYFFIDKQNDISKFFTKVIPIFDWFFNLESGIYTAKDNEKKIILDTFLDRIGNLITSGPKNTNRSNSEAFLLRRFFKKNLQTLENNLEKIVDTWIENEIKILSHYGHYDLHCNNFLTDSNFSEIKLIDFENIKSPGIWISDIIYFHATLYGLLSSQKLLQNEIKNNACQYICHIEPKFDENQVQKVVDLFCSAADANSRFRLYNKGTKITKMLEYANSVKNLV